MYTISPQNMPDFASEILKEYERKQKIDGYFNIQETLSIIPIQKFRNVNRSLYYEDFKKEKLVDFLRDAQGKSKILDLDLDYFVPENQNNIIMKDNEIKIIIEELLGLCEWDLITVALSPDYCVTNHNALHLLKLYCEIAGLKLLNEHQF
jgi:hypothetical protein